MKKRPLQRGQGRAPFGRAFIQTAKADLLRAWCGSRLCLPARASPSVIVQRWPDGRLDRQVLGRSGPRFVFTAFRSERKAGTSPARLEKITAHTQTTRAPPVMMPP